MNQADDRERDRGGRDRRAVVPGWAAAMADRLVERRERRVERHLDAAVGETGALQQHPRQHGEHDRQDHAQRYDQQRSLALDRAELPRDRRQHGQRGTADQHGRHRQPTALESDHQAVGLDPRPRQRSPLLARPGACALAAGVEHRQVADHPRHVAPDDGAGDELARALGEAAERAEPGNLGIPPALPVGNLERAHHQPVGLLEVVGMGERLRERQLRHHLRLGACVDANLVQRALDGLRRIARDQPVGLTQPVDDQVAVVGLPGRPLAVRHRAYATRRAGRPRRGRC